MATVIGRGYFEMMSANTAAVKPYLNQHPACNGIIKPEYFDCELYKVTDLAVVDLLAGITITLLRGAEDGWKMNKRRLLIWRPG